MILNFGDVVSQRGVNYAYLGASASFVYLARILVAEDPHAAPGAASDAESHPEHPALDRGGGHEELKVCPGLGLGVGG